MKFRGIDGQCDWAFGQGRSSYFTKERAIAANARTRLLVFLGEIFWKLDAGVDWWNLLGGKNPVAQAGIILQCRSILIESEGIEKVIEVRPVFHPVTRALTVTYTTDTIYSRGVVGSVTPNV